MIFFSPFGSLCSGAEYLLQVVRGAIPHSYFDSTYTISTAEVAVHVLDFLYKKLDQVCLVQGGEVVSLSHSVSFFLPLSLRFLISSQADNIWTRWKDFTCCCKSLLELYCLI